MKACTQCKAKFAANATRCPLDGAPLIELPDPLIGQWIGGRYRVENKIGAGGMASVYRASHELLGRWVAIKFLAPELALDPTQKQRFLREARATNRIKHEHIVDISDYGEEDDGKVYLVMELLEGEPMAARIGRGPIDPREAIDLMLQTTSALARAHELEVIHRDLKPENIFLTPRGEGWHVKLLDFGLAHVRNEVRLTALGSVFGTPEYMSPEQARGAPVGPTSDIYSLGVVFFEMLTCRLPFEGSTAELIVKHIRNAPPAVSTYMPSLPPEVDALVAKMLAKEASKRHQDAYHLMEELNALASLFPDTTRRTGSANRGAAPTESRVVTRPSSPTSVRSWVERRDVFRRAMELAYPKSDAPEWVVQAAHRIESLVEYASGLDREMERVARLIADRDESANDIRDRIGRALDELARDESSVLRQVEDLERRIERSRTRSAQSAAEFQRSWTEASSLLPGGVLSTVEAVNAVDAAARRANTWRQAVKEIEEAEDALRTRRAARDDLRFQVAQLKGRLGALNAEVDHDLSSVRQRATELGAQMAATQEQLAEAGSALAAHLSEFPAARPVIAHGPHDRPTVLRP